MLQMPQFFPTRAVAISIGPFAVHWYGLMYLLGFLLGMWLLPRLLKYRGLQLSKQQQESLTISVFFGVLLGGRLGYVLFYDFSHYLSHPLQILVVWQGGMSSHGGIIGVAIALVLYCRWNSVSIRALTDVLVVPIAIGLALGRVGNFMNQELYGTVTTLPWGIVIPGVEGLRHPTQIYAIIKDLCIAAVCFWHLKSTRAQSAGKTTALFFILYSMLRFAVEVFREQPHGYLYLGPLQLSMGQVLTIPVLLLGIGVWYWSGQRIERGE